MGMCLVRAPKNVGILRTRIELHFLSLNIADTYIKALNWKAAGQIRIPVYCIGGKFTVLRSFITCMKQ